MARESLKAKGEGKVVVKIDELLKTALFKGAKKKGGGEYPDVMGLQDLGRQFVSRLDKFVAVRSASTGEVSVKKGALAPIEISSGKKGPKVVTRVQGMEALGIPPEMLATECKKLFQGGTSVQPLPGKNQKNQEVWIQGNCPNELSAYLQNYFKVPKRYVAFGQLYTGR